MFSFAKHAFTLIGDMGDEASQGVKRIDDHPATRLRASSVRWEPTRRGCIS
jgi:hypothetical protein